MLWKIEKLLTEWSFDLNFGYILLVHTMSRWAVDPRGAGSSSGFKPRTPNWANDSLLYIATPTIDNLRF